MTAYAYDDAGRLNYTYDNLSRLTSVLHQLAGSSCGDATSGHGVNVFDYVYGQQRRGQ